VGDEPSNGARYVTHQRLTDLLEAHRREESEARHSLANRILLDLGTRVTVAEHERLSSEVRDVKTTVARHDDSLLKIEWVGTTLNRLGVLNVVGWVGVLVAIWVTR
jgi:hypothetical protein